MKRLLAFLLLGMFMISFTSALDFDNWVNYENKDLKVRIVNNWNIGEDLGTAELKSHKSVNEVLKVAPGKDTVVMFYDFDFGKIYKNGLGEVGFINMTSGENIEKDYHFVIWDKIYEEKNNYSKICNNVFNKINNSYSQFCENVFVGTYIEEKYDWVKLDVRDIPDGKTRIGLATDVNVGETIDGIWTIAGKKIKKHSVWTASLNVDINNYYTLNDSAANTDVDDGTDNDEGVLIGGETTSGVSVAGKIGTAFNLDGNDYIDIGTMGNFGSNFGNGISVAFWINTTMSAQGAITGNNLNPSSQTFGFYLNRRYDLAFDTGKLAIVLRDVDGNLISCGTTNDEIFRDGNFHHIIMNIDGPNQTCAIYVDGDSKPISFGNTAVADNFINFTFNNSLGSENNAGTPSSNITGIIDEVGIWNRILTSEEATQIYNNNTGITYNSNPPISPDVVLISPIDNANLTSESVNFLVNVTDDEQVVNVTLFIDGVATQSNLSGFNGTYTFSETILEGDHNWSVLAIDNSSSSNQSETRSFSVEKEIWRGIQFTYDNFDDASINTSLWNTSTSETGVYTATITEISSTIELFYLEPRPSSTSTASEVLTSNNLPTSATTQSIVASVVLEVDADTGDGGSATFSAFGNVIKQLTSVSSDSSNWTFISNYSNGSLQYDVFDDDVFHSIIIPTTDSISFSAVQNLASGSIWEEGKVVVNYINYNKSNVVLNSPSDDFMSTSLTVDFNSSINITNAATLVNMSLWTNETGTWEIRNITTGLNSTTSTQTWERNYSDGDSFIWNVQGCDSNGICGFAMTNYTVNIDNTAPILSVQSPIGTLNYGSIGQPETLNVTFTDVGLDSCWYNYNGTNITIDGCLSGVKNSTTFVLENGNTNMTIYANDSSGNLNTSFIEWEYIIFEQNQTYSTSSFETATENFGVWVNYNSSKWNSISAQLNYNGTNYSGIINGSGDTIAFDSEIEIPQIVPASANLSFYWIIALTNATSTVNINTRTNNQLVSEVILSICAVNETPYIRFLTVNSENPFPTINATFKSSWRIGDIASEAQSLNFSYEDVTELNNTWEFCISPDTKNYTVSVDIESDATSFAKNFYYISAADYVANQTTNITLYLLNDSLATPTTLLVRDRYQRTIDNVLIYVQLYDVGTDLFYTVTMGKSNQNGEDIVYLNWYDSLYRFILVEDGSTVLTTEAYKVGDSPQIFQPEEDITYDLDKFRDFEYSLIFNNDTNNFVLTYVKPSGLVESGCLRVLKRTALNDTEICETCSTSASATLYCNIGSSGNGTFIATFYATGSLAVIKWITHEVGVGMSETIFELLDKDNAAFYTILMSSLVLLIFLVSPVFGIFGILGGLLLSSSLGFSLISYGTFLFISCVGGAIIWLLKR